MLKSKPWAGGNAIKKLVRELNHNQVAFCREASLDYTVYGSLLHRGRINSTNAEKLVRSLNITLEDLTGKYSVVITPDRFNKEGFLPSDSMSLNGEELVFLVEAQKILGDLSLGDIVRIINKQRAKNKLGEA